jgi:hypothetical protein
MEILSTMKAPQLHTVRILSNPIDEEGIIHFLKSPLMRHVKTLILDSVGISGLSMKAIK